MRAVVIGPGRIGCGFAGQALRDSGYEVVFLARNPVMAEHLDRLGRYRVWVTEGGRTHERWVEPVRAACLRDRERALEEIARADVVLTAVGAGSLPVVAPLIAAGLARRTTGANVLGLENLRRATRKLRELVLAHLPTAAHATRHGFSGGLVHRVVARRVGDPSGGEPLAFVSDSPEEFHVDATSLIAPLPAIRGMIATDRYEAFVERKLYTYSAGHAALAYLGHLKGYRYVHTAVRDPEIRAAVLAAMAEGQRGLAARYGRELAGDERLLHDILARFENAGLGDRIQRVGRDPRRKLAADERLVGAARLAERAGYRPRNLALAAAAALCFVDADDPSSTEMHDEVGRAGPDRIIQRVCGLSPERGLGRRVCEDCKHLFNGHGPESLLLSLRAHLWS